jgi:hypothetical protein
MRLVNHTAYTAKQLRAIVMHVAQQELDPKQRKYITVHVHYRHQPGNRADRRGRRIERKIGAGLRYNSLCVELAKDPRLIDRTYLGVQLAHEFAECRGQHHKDMYGGTRYGYRNRQKAWGEPWRTELTAAAFPLHIKAKPARPAPSVLREKELQRARLRVAAWERKAKLAATKLRVWKRTVARIERRLAATAADTSAVAANPLAPEHTSRASAD